MTRFTVIATALATAATPLLAQNNMSTDYSDLIRSRDITDGEIYTSNEAYDEGSWLEATYDGVQPDWNEIGEIEDLVLDREGKLIGIIAEVGGFLDIADKHVMLNMEDMKLVPLGDDEYAVITRMSEEDLEARESVDEGFWN